MEIKKRHVTILLAVMVTLSLLVASCGPVPTQAPTEAAVEPAKEEAAEPAKEEEPVEESAGVLKIAHYEYLEHLDPQLHHHRSSWAELINVQEPLVIRDASGKEILPHLATSWEQVDDLTWEFKLREGVTFHNGEPFNAESVKFTLERLIDPDVGAPLGYLWVLLDSVEIVDEYTVHIKTKEPFGALLPTLTTAYMMPPVAGAEEDYGQKGYGTGPFKVVSYDRQKGLVLEPYADYWGEPAKVSRLEFIPLVEASTRVAALRSGDVDIITNVPAEETEALESEGYKVTIIPGNDTLNLCVGRGSAKQDEAPWNNPKFVEALTFALDRQALVDTIFVGQGASAATSQLSPTIFGYYGQPVMERDLERAKAALAEAGIEPGFKAEFIIPKGARPKSVEAGEAIAGMLYDIGLEVEVVPMEPAAAWPVLDSSDFDLFLDGWGTVTLDGDINLYTNFNVKTNREGYDNPEVTRLVELGRSSSDPDERYEAYKKVQEILWDGESRRIPLYHLQDIYAYSPRVQGWEPRPDQLFPMAAASVE